MKKKAQVTVFIILAILIIAVIVLLFVFRDKIGLDGGVDSEISPIYNFVSYCILETGLEGFIELGENGGYYELPNKVTPEGIPYYYINREIIIPTNKELEKHISLYVEDNLRYCIFEFIDFPEYNVTYQEIDVQSKISENTVTIDVRWPVYVRYKDKSHKIEDFRDNTVFIRIDTIRKVVEELVDLFDKEPSNLCISCMQEIGHRYNVTISSKEIDSETLIFKIVDLGGTSQYGLQFAFKNE
jgi:hypothetical protein